MIEEMANPITLWNVKTKSFFIDTAVFTVLLCKKHDYGSNLVIFEEC